jgi:hypothetical protein
MINYIKLGKVRGVSIETSLNLGRKPFFRKNRFHHEIIIDIPYVQIIYTTGKWHKLKRVPIRRAINGNKKTRKVTKRIN